MQDVMGVKLLVGVLRRRSRSLRRARVPAACRAPMAVAVRLEEHDEQTNRSGRAGNWAEVGAYTWAEVRIAGVKAAAERSATLVSASYTLQARGGSAKPKAACVGT